jgi:hypothetical protein
MNFINKKLFTRQDFELLTGSLKYRKRTLFESLEYEILYDHIGNKKKIQSTINNNLFVLALSSMIIGALFLLGSLSEISPLFFFIGGLFLVVTFINRKKTITIEGLDGNTIELYYTNSNKEEIIEFADQIIASSNSFLLNKYGRIDRDLPIESQLSNLEFLRNREILTDDDFESLKNRLLGRNNKTKIGFSG